MSWPIVYTFWQKHIKHHINPTNVMLAVLVGVAVYYVWFVRPKEITTITDRTETTTKDTTRQEDVITAREVASMITRVLDYNKDINTTSKETRIGNSETKTSKRTVERDPKTNDPIKVTEEDTTTKVTTGESATNESKVVEQGHDKETVVSTVKEEETSTTKTTEQSKVDTKIHEETKIISKAAWNTTKNHLGVMYDANHQLYATWDVAKAKSYHAFVMANTVPRMGLGLRKDVIGDTVFVGIGGGYDLDKKDSFATLGVGIKF